MTGKIKTCIYCSQSEDNRFRGVEHVIPQAFGTFGDKTPTLHCVCDDCNKYFGRELDQLLSRETIEGVVRYNQGQRSREARPQRRLHITLAPGEETGDFAGMKVAVDGTTSKLMKPVAQFHIVNFATGQNEIYFKHELEGLSLPEKTYGRPASDGQPGTWKCNLFAPSKEEHDACVALLRANGIHFTSGKALTPPEAWSRDDVADMTLPVEIEAEIDTPHKRALAKILMNFVAFYLRRDEALRPRWDFLRNYVRNGAGLIRMRLSHQPFWTSQETGDLRFQDNGINVRVENLDDNIIGVIQFYNRFSYEMILVEKDFLIADLEIGYRFVPGAAPIGGEKRKLQQPDPEA